MAILALDLQQLQIFRSRPGPTLGSGACSVGRCLAGVAHSSLDSVQGSTVSFRAEALRHICDLRLIGQFEKEGGLGWDAYYT